MVPQSEETDTAMSEKHLRLEQPDDPKSDALDREARLIDLVEKLATQAQSSGFTPQQLETILARAGAATAEGMRISLKPENPDHRHESAFFTAADKARYGSFDQRPTLTRKTFFVGAEEKDERLMPAEIEEYNAITSYREARGGKWKAEIRRNGQEEQLWVWVPIETQDQRMDLPSLLLILMELNGRANTANLHALVRQIEMLKGMVVTGKQMAPADLERELLAQA